MDADSIILFITRNYAREIEDLTKSFPTNDLLVVDFERIAQHEPNFRKAFKLDSLGVITQLKNALKTILTGRIHFRNKFDCIKIGFTNLPPEYRIRIKDLSQAHLNKVIGIEGLINSVSEIRHEIVISAWHCKNCDDETYVETFNGMIRKPFCVKCKTFRSVEAKEKDNVMLDKQFGVLQELLENMQGTLNPPMLRYFLTRPNLNRINPGNKVLFCGIYKSKVKETGIGSAKSVVETYFEVLNIQIMDDSLESIEITPEEEIKIKELAASPDLESTLISSFCPEVVGYNEIKFGIICQIFGGASDCIQNDSRNEIHIILVGDPGISKSTLLMYVNKLHPKSIFVSGKGASGVGVTASVEKDSETGVHVLKAGAMVLASGGIMMLDEMDKMKQDQRDAMHTAMEQRRLSINKAGINATLITETSILAAANPKYGFFKSLDGTSLAEEFNIPATLLSRFDIIFVMKDDVNEQKDMAIASFISHRFVAEMVSESTFNSQLSIPFMRKYIAYAKKNIKPLLTVEADEIARKFYVKIRQEGKRQNVVSATARDLQGIIRIAQAIAKMHLRCIVTKEDMDKAISLKMFALKQSSFNSETGTIDASIQFIGTSSTSVVRERELMSIIKQLSSGEDGAPKKDVIYMASQNGMDVAKILYELEKLIRDGALFIPKGGRLAVTSPSSW